MEIDSIRSLTTMTGVIFCPIRRLLLKKVACVSVCVYRSTHTFRSGDSSGCHSSGADPLFCQAATFISLALAHSQQILGNLPVFIPPALITSMYHHAFFFFFFGMDSGDLTQVLMIALLQTGQSSWLW